MICFNRGQLELGDKAIKLVNDEDGPETVLPSLSQYCNRLASSRQAKQNPLGRNYMHIGTYLSTNTFNNINEDKGTVTQARGSRDFA